MKRYTIGVGEDGRDVHMTAGTRPANYRTTKNATLQNLKRRGVTVLPTNANFLKAYTAPPATPSRPSTSKTRKSAARALQREMARYMVRDPSFW